MTRLARATMAWCVAGVVMVGAAGAGPTDGSAGGGGVGSTGASSAAGAGGSAAGDKGTTKLKGAMGSLQERLGVEDGAEWDALRERIVRVSVLAKQLRNVREGKAVSAGWRPGSGKGGSATAGGGGDANAYPAKLEWAMGRLSEAAVAVRAEMRAAEAPAGEVEQRLAELRKARGEAEGLLADELKKAREELRGLVTPRQELTLVVYGVLD